MMGSVETRTSVGVSSQELGFDDKSLYQDYLGMFLADDFVERERVPWIAGRSPVLRIDQETWDDPESIITRVVSEEEAGAFWIIGSIEEYHKILIHPSSFVVLRSLLERRCQLETGDVISPYIVRTAESTFVSYGQDLRITDRGKQVFLTIDGSYEMVQDDMLWNQLEAGIRIFNPNLGEEIDELRREQKDTGFNQASRFVRRILHIS